MKKNILFVDDEENILKSVKRLFFKSNYNIFLASSAKEGFEIIKNNKIDVLISDVKMPEMDGLTFLKEVKDNYPSIDRIVLSGFVEMNSVLKAIIKGIAFDYITKPWNNEILVDKLNYVTLMRDQVGNSKIIKKLNQIEVIPKLDNIYDEFVNALDEEKSLHELAVIAQKDIAITTKIVQLVNSAFYTKKKIGSIEQAIEILGIRGISNIIQNSLLSEKIELNDMQQKELKKYNRMITNSNYIFKKIYEIYKAETIPKELELIGMTPYIGKIILLYEYFDSYKEISDILIADSSRSFWEAQLKSQHHDFTYVELGAYFLNLWNFPLVYFQVLYNFMTPHTAPENIKEVIAILNLSREFVNKQNLDITIFDKEHTKKIIISRMEELINDYN